MRLFPFPLNENLTMTTQITAKVPTLEIDVSHLKVFETKTSPIYSYDVVRNEISTIELTPTQFSLVLYARSKESENNTTTKAEEYFSSLLVDTPDVLEMKKLPFSQWCIFIEDNGYVHITESQVKAVFEKAYKLRKEQHEKEKEGKNV